jgi:hypothetical protein
MDPVAARSIKKKPEKQKVGDDRDPDALTAAKLGTFILKPVNQVKEFIRLQLFVARALTPGEGSRRESGRAGWNFS